MKLLTYTCRMCGQEFKRKNKGPNRNIYCSRNCLSRSQGGVQYPDQSVVYALDYQPNFLGEYHVTIDGEVYKKVAGGWCRLNQYPSKGYRLVRVGGRSWRVHRAVAIVYCDNPLKKPHVNHIDCDKSNNKASNLEWVTHDENMIHAFENGKRAATVTPVIGVGRNGEGIFLRCIEEARKFGFIPQNISRVINGGARKAKGYTWLRYAEMA